MTSSIALLTASLAVLTPIHFNLFLPSKYLLDNSLAHPSYLSITTIGIPAWYATHISFKVPLPPPIAIITSQDNTRVNSLPPPTPNPEGIITVGLKSPYVFLSLLYVTPTVMPPLILASLALIVDNES